MVKNPPANAEDIGVIGSIPGLGRSPGVGNGNLLQYSCLENSMDRGMPGGLQSMVSQRVRHNRVTGRIHTHTHTHTLFNEAPLSLSPPTLKFLESHSLYNSVIRTDMWKLVYFHLEGCINKTCEFQIAGMWGVFFDGYFYAIFYRRFLWCPYLIFDSVWVNGHFHVCCQQTTPKRSSSAFLP